MILFSSLFQGCSHDIPMELTLLHLMQFCEDHGGKEEPDAGGGASQGYMRSHQTLFIQHNEQTNLGALQWH